jgi:hypothetical protein
MAGFFENLLRDVAGGFFGSDYLRDYTHASKTFRTNSYQNAPKYKFIFHTYFNINVEAWPDSTDKNIGLLVKDVKLPTYNFNTTQLNQYNRKRIVQTKIRYEPVNITFHDDNDNLINRMWYSYYTYYYADATKPTVFLGNRGAIPPKNGVANSQQTTNADYNITNIYENSIKGDDNWGYIGETGTPKFGHKVPFFKNITIFGFNQHSFTAYTLINPIITNFAHDTYSYSDGAGVMQNQMTVDYETVVYNEGAIDGRKPGDIVTGFGDQATYDREPSPITKPGSQGNILGQGGLVDAAGGFVENLSNGNILGAIQNAGTAYNTYKNTNLKQTAKRELNSMLTQAVRNPNTNRISPNRNTLFDIPNRSSTPYFIGTAGAPTISNPPTPNPVTEIPTAGKQVRK